MIQTLADFIRHARQKDMDHATIRMLLLSAGWREKDVAKALAEEGLDLPVPEPPSTGGAKEAFQYLMALTALCLTVVVVILLFFEYLDLLLPDPADATSWYTAEYHQQSVRWLMATLIVAFPIYAGFMYWIERDVVRTPERSKSPIRRWLTYLALFAAAVTMMIDIMVLVYGFLQGDLTTRFVLRIVTILVITATVFCYYLMSLQLPENGEAKFLRRLDWSFGGVTVLLVTLALTLGATMIESPFTARLRRLDRRRIADLREIQYAIERQVLGEEDRWGPNAYRDQPKTMKRPLPQRLKELNRFVQHEEHRNPLSLHDPETGQEYQYSIRDKSSFELCAEFALAAHDEAPAKWNHEAGRHCITFDVMKRE